MSIIFLVSLVRQTRLMVIVPAGLIVVSGLLVVRTRIVGQWMGYLDFVPKYNRIERRMGTYGFCLQYDLSRPINGTQADGYNAPKYACLTWLPLGISASNIDMNNQDINAGYNPQGDDSVNNFGRMYCVNNVDYFDYFSRDLFNKATVLYNILRLVILLM